MQHNSTEILCTEVIRILDRVDFFFYFLRWGRPFFHSSLTILAVENDWDSQIEANETKDLSFLDGEWVIVFLLCWRVRCTIVITVVVIKLIKYRKHCFPSENFKIINKPINLVLKDTFHYNFHNFTVQKTQTQFHVSPRDDLCRNYRKYYFFDRPKYQPMVPIEYI